MQRARKTAALVRVLGAVQRTKGDELVFFCPRRRHGKPKLSVNVVDDMFNCWACGDFKGRDLVPLLRLVAGNPDLDEYVRGRPIRQDHTTRQRTYDRPLLPREFIPLWRSGRGPYYDHAMRYLASRGVGMDRIVSHKLGYCEDGELRYRIIFPSFDATGALNFVVGRYMYDDPTVVKYRHGRYDKDVIFNEYLIDWDRSVVLVEGPFDSLKADNSVPILGLNVTCQSLIFRRIVTEDVDVLLAFDSDALERQLQVAEMFVRAGVVCGIVDLGGRKDVGEMAPDEFADRVRHVKVIDGRLDLTRARLDGCV